MPTAKTTFLVACALATCAAACGTNDAADADTRATSSAEVAACQAEAPRDVVIDLDGDVGNLQCRAIMGWFITFTWEHESYMAWVSDTPGQCPAKLDALRRASAAAGGLHGVVREEARTDGTIHWVASELTVDVEGGFTFRATKCSDRPTDG